LAESYKRTENERKASQEWLNNSRSNLERALSNIDKYQERKLLTIQVILLVFVGAFLVNLLSSTFYDLLITSDLALQRVYLNTGISVGSIIALIVIFVLLRQQLSKYEPSLPVLSFLIKPENTEAFLQDSQFKELMEYLEQGKLKDFRVFATNFFESLSNYFLFMFRTDKVETKPMKEYETFYDPKELLQKFPIITKEYDLSPLSLTGVKTTLEVKLAPDFIQLFTPESDEPALNSFYLMFRLRILNPKHCDANKFLEGFFHVYASRIIKYSSPSIAYAFNKLIGFSVAEKKT
jgi:hypothetical protein